jgi:aspartate/glutamate racemase
LLHTAGAQAIMLGGTDLALAFNEKGAGFPIVDWPGHSCRRHHKTGNPRLRL